MKGNRWFALSVILYLCLALTACFAADVPVTTEEPKTLQWSIIDDYTGKRSGWNGKAMDQVFDSLPQKPDITLYTGDQEQQVSYLLAHDQLPDLITVPTGGSLAEKLRGSGHWYGIRELSEELYERIPEEIRRYYQRNEDDLYSLPGGYTAENYRPAAIEGVFVREEYYALLDTPSMDTLGGFQDALKQFVRMMTDNQLIGSEELVPLVFGVNNGGFHTVEHLCGVYPLYRDGENTYHRAFAPQIQNVLTFFDALDAFTAYAMFDEYSANRLTELMKNNVFVYIGPADFVEVFNQENPRNTYVPVTPPFAEDGFLKAQSRYGRYETFVSRYCDPESAAELLLALSSAASSRTFMYGLEDENWIMVNGKVTPLKATVKSMREDQAAFLHQTGIAAFPFLSRDGALNPYVEQTREKALDITTETVFFAPTDYHHYYVTQMDRRLKDYYVEVAGSSVTVADIAERIRVLSVNKEPLTFSR